MWSWCHPWDVAVGSSAWGCCSPSLAFDSLCREADGARLPLGQRYGVSGGLGRGFCAGLPQGWTRVAAGVAGCGAGGCGMWGWGSWLLVEAWVSRLLRRGHRRAPRRGWGGGGRAQTHAAVPGSVRPCAEQHPVLTGGSPAPPSAGAGKPAACPAKAGRAGPGRPRSEGACGAAGRQRRGARLREAPALAPR